MDDVGPETIMLRLTLWRYLMPKSPRRRRLEKVVHGYIRDHYDRMAARVFARDAADLWKTKGSFGLGEHPRAAIGPEYAAFAVSVMSLALHRGGFSRKSAESMGLSSLKLLVTVLGADPNEAAEAVADCYANALRLQPFAQPLEESDWEALPADEQGGQLMYQMAGLIADRIVEAVGRGERKVEPTAEEVERIDALVESRVEYPPPTE